MYIVKWLLEYEILEKNGTDCGKASKAVINVERDELKFKSRKEEESKRISENLLFESEHCKRSSFHKERKGKERWIRIIIKD